MKNLAELAFGNSIYAGDDEGGQFEQYAEEVQLKKSWNFTGHQLNVIIRRKKIHKFGSPISSLSATFFPGVYIYVLSYFLTT